MFQIVESHGTECTETDYIDDFSTRERCSQPTVQASTRFQLSMSSSLQRDLPYSKFN